MEIEQCVGKFSLREDLALDPAKGADEKRRNRRILADKFAGDREPGIEMSAGSAAGENDPHAGTAIGSVAVLPITFSRVLPIFTRMPVNNIVSTRFERPNEMNGR